MGENGIIKEWLPVFLSDFHKTHLKPLGFKKKGRTFSRDMGKYWERYNFQGSMQNYPGVPKWRFYLNVGVEFKNLQPRIYWSLFPNTHWAVRIDQVVPGAPHQWHYNQDTDQAALAKALIRLVTDASENIATDIDAIYDICGNTRS